MRLFDKNKIKDDNTYGPWQPERSAIQHLIIYVFFIFVDHHPLLDASSSAQNNVWVSFFFFPKQRYLKWISFYSDISQTSTVLAWMGLCADVQESQFDVEDGNFLPMPRFVLVDYYHLSCPIDIDYDVNLNPFIRQTFASSGFCMPAIHFLICVCNFDGSIDRPLINSDIQRSLYIFVAYNIHLVFAIGYKVLISPTVLSFYFLFFRFVLLRLFTWGRDKKISVCIFSF